MICEYDAWTWGEVAVRYEVCPVGCRVWARRIYLHSVLFALLGAFLPTIICVWRLRVRVVLVASYRGSMRSGHLRTRENVTQPRFRTQPDLNTAADSEGKFG